MFENLFKLEVYFNNSITILHASKCLPKTVQRHWGNPPPFPLKLRNHSIQTQSSLRPHHLRTPPLLCG